MFALVGGAVLSAGAVGAYRHFLRSSHAGLGASSAAVVVLGVVEVQDQFFLNLFMQGGRGVERAVWRAERMTGDTQSRVVAAVDAANRIFRLAGAIDTTSEFGVALAASDAHVCFKFVAVAMELGERSESRRADARRWLETSLALYKHADFPEVGLDGLFGSMQRSVQLLCSRDVLVDVFE